jgi:hypothetical protein
MLQQKGQDTSGFPRLSRVTQVPADESRSERDIEEKLLEPFLLRLGYTSKDWTRQLLVRMGRGERVYPDGVIAASAKRGEESA